jgi:hypothetical protein
MKKIVVLIGIFCATMRLIAQPANEIGCFSNFEPSNAGNSRVNAYLLSMLVHFNYPTVLLNNEDAFASPVMALYSDPKLFLEKYKEKVLHYFPSPANMPRKAGTPVIGIQTSNPVIVKSVKEGTTSIRPGANAATNTAARPAVASPALTTPYITIVAGNNHQGYDPEATVISTAGYIIINFRGTDRVGSRYYGPADLVRYAIGEWVVTNFNAFQVQAPYGLPGRVHKGFSESLQLILPRLVDTLNKLDAGNKKIWITGHSLGSAHAQLCGAYLRKAYGISAYAIYAYASPHVGDEAFVAQLNDYFPAGRLQRFDFMYDPATLVPRSLLGYKEAGIRNHYRTEQGGVNFLYNAAEEPWYNTPNPVNACQHHSNWYARATYFELIDKRPDLVSKLPAVPPIPELGCSEMHIRQASNTNTGALGGFLKLGDEDVSEGVYMIVHEPTGKVLDAGQSSATTNGMQPAIREGKVRTDNKVEFYQRWRVTRVGGIAGGYTIENLLSGKVLDADFPCLEDNGCKVTIRDRLAVVLPDRRNQEWYIERIGNSTTFKIRNVLKGEQVLDPGAGRSNGTKVGTNQRGPAISQQWRFIRIH